MKALKQVKKPIIRLQIVKQQENEHEIEAFIEKWREYADEVSIVDYKDTSGTEVDTTPLPEWWCAQLWQRLFVLADGDVVPCCRAVAEGTKKLFVLGNIKKKFHTFK